MRALASTVSPPAPAVEESSGPMAAAVPAPPPPIPWAIHTAWADPLPLHKWFKFDVVKVPPPHFTRCSPVSSQLFVLLDRKCLFGGIEQLLW